MCPARTDSLYGGEAMAQLSNEETVAKALSGGLEVARAIRGLVDRETGLIKIREGQLIDFKERIDMNSACSIQELAKDLLGFSNTAGGLLLVGVTDEGKIAGHNALDSRQLRHLVGPYVGTRVSFAVGVCDVGAQGATFIVPFLLVQRAATAGPNLLRKDIEMCPQRAQKVKFRAGSLFYREDNQTRVEPPGENLLRRAALLKFTYATPSSRNSLRLADDRPGFRVYDHINDRFFGREDEVGELLGKLGNPRGRGVSIAGFGGIGKTELAIEVVLRLSTQRRFKKIYSGSAKTLMMTPSGARHTDPMFEDYPTFIRDLAGWLGLDVTSTPGLESTEAIAAACVKELKGQERVLLFVDNLETLGDLKLFNFLDNQLPDSVSLITTSRVHKLRNFMYQKELAPLPARECAKLLRHELQRQGLDKLADTPIGDLEDKAVQLYGTPLAIRWFAWACAKNPTLWHSEPSTLFHKQNIDEFCVAHTLRNLPAASILALAAIAALQDKMTVGINLLLRATGVSAEVLERALWDLECAGLICTQTDDLDGSSSFIVVPLTVPAARELARKSHWEQRFAKACTDCFATSPHPPTDDPLINDIAQRSARDVRNMTAEQRQELLGRIKRSKGKRMPIEVKLLIVQLEAECYRHSDAIITARDLYVEASEELLKSKIGLNNARLQEILLEAATVVKQSGISYANLRCAAKYLEAVAPFSEQRLRVFSTLAEIYAMLGREDLYRDNRDKARKILDEERFQLSYAAREKSEAALDRAEMKIESWEPGTGDSEPNVGKGKAI